MSFLDEISELTTLNSSEILEFVKSAPHRYKKYTIPKRNGRGVRLIAQPSKEVKYFQYIAKKIILDALPVHPVASAYQKGSSIKGNALAHVKNKFLLKMDFRDFFPSIRPKLLLDVINKKIGEISNNDILLVERLFFWQERRNTPLQLSIGAPSSPLISNIVMYDFDHYFHEYCFHKGISYTRYADDLSFSTNEKGILFDIPAIITQYLEKHEYLGLFINESKTVFTSKKHNRHVTGIVLNNDNKLSLGRDRKRRIKTLVYLFKTKTLEKENIEVLKGLLAFASDVEPDFIERLKIKFGQELISNIIRYQVC